LVIDPSFKWATERWLDKDILPFIEQQKPSKRVKQAAKYEHAYDFRLGYWLGYTIGIALQHYKLEYKREPTDEEIMEIEELVEIRLGKIREYLSKMKSTLS
jgi:hypothetical protein